MHRQACQLLRGAAAPAAVAARLERRLFLFCARARFFGRARCREVADRPPSRAAVVALCRASRGRWRRSGAVRSLTRRSSARAPQEREILPKIFKHSNFASFVRCAGAAAATRSGLGPEPNLTVRSCRAPLTRGAALCAASAQAAEQLRLPEVPHRPLRIRRARLPARRARVAQDAQAPRRAAPVQETQLRVQGGPGRGLRQPHRRRCAALAPPASLASHGRAGTHD